MEGTRRFARRDHLVDVVRAVFPGRRLDDVTRLSGGSKKGVYRLTLDNGFTTVLYVWDQAENYWPADRGDGGNPADPFSDASGIDLFEASHARLRTIGVRLPRVYLADRSRTRYPADIAVLEDVGGQSLQTLLRDDPRAAEPTLVRLGDTLRLMHQHRGPGIGKVALVDNGHHAPARTCQQVVLERARVHLRQAAAQVGRIAEAHERLADALHEFAADVGPRAEYGLIHGELGPDHVFVDPRGDPVILDIEGTMFFDVEWEHAFLRFRFGEHYRWLGTGGLDDQRLRLYTLALHLSLVAGPLRLLDGDYPDRELMRDIVESNVERALAFARQAL